MRKRFKDRRDAGRQLAALLDEYSKRDAIALGLARGGVPVAAEVAKRLEIDLDVLIVRKIGAPGHPELAVGAMTSRGIVVRNEPLILSLGLTNEEFDTLVSATRLELNEKIASLRADDDPPTLEGRTVILVDDGIATGSSMEVAIRAVEEEGPEVVVAAVPVAPPSTAQRLAGMVDDMQCVMTPEPFLAVGTWYRDFTQVKDADVLSALGEA
jgi:putative phosphoribosyl transferase